MQDDSNLPYLLSQGFSNTILKRFWSYVTKTDECWLWTASTNAAGYGQINKGPYCRGVWLSHRLSWVIHKGPIPDGIFVLHDCPQGDCPRCVNPSHLWLGNQTDNVADMMAKDRGAKGETRGHAKLTDQSVREILAIGNTKKQYELAKQYGVSGSVISEVLARKVWKHVSL